MFALQVWPQRCACLSVQNFSATSAPSNALARRPSRSSAPDRKHLHHNELASISAIQVTLTAPSTEVDARLCCIAPCEGIKVAGLDSNNILKAADAYCKVGSNADYDSLYST
jgi:hypothetical protein